MTGTGRRWNGDVLWPIAALAGVLTTVAVAIAAATGESESDTSTVVLVASMVLLVYLPLTAWGLTRAGTRPICTRRDSWRNFRCRGDHGYERRLAVALVAITGAATFAVVAAGVWEAAVALAMFPLGFLVLASGYRTRPAWEAEVAARAGRAARLRAPAKRRTSR